MLYVQTLLNEALWSCYSFISRTFVLIILDGSSQLFCAIDCHLGSCELGGPDVDLAAAHKCMLHEVL